MGRYGRCNQRIALERVDESFGPRKSLSRRLRVRHWKLDHRLAQDPAQPRSLGFPGNLLLEVIHVGKRRGSRLDHFERRKSGSRADEVRRYSLRLRGEDV